MSAGTLAGRTLKVQFLGFDECPNQGALRRLVGAVLEDRHVQDPIEELNATNPEDTLRLRFPGTPTVRINGLDIEPNYVDNFANPKPEESLWQAKRTISTIPRSSSIR